MNITNYFAVFSEGGYILGFIHKDKLDKLADVWEKGELIC